MIPELHENDMNRLVKVPIIYNVTVFHLPSRGACVSNMPHCHYHAEPRKDILRSQNE